MTITLICGTDEQHTNEWEVKKSNKNCRFFLYFLSAQQFPQLIRVHPFGQFQMWSTVYNGWQSRCLTISLDRKRIASSTYRDTRGRGQSVCVYMMCDVTTNVFKRVERINLIKIEIETRRKKIHITLDFDWVDNLSFSLSLVTVVAAAAIPSFFVHEFLLFFFSISLFICGRALYLVNPRNGKTGLYLHTGNYTMCYDLHKQIDIPTRTRTMDTQNWHFV